MIFSVFLSAFHNLLKARWRRVRFVSTSSSNYGIIHTERSINSNEMLLHILN